MDPHLREGRGGGAGAVELSGDLLGAFLALMPDAAVAVNSAGRVVAANDHADRLFGYDVGSLVGLQIEALVPERARHRHREHRAGFEAHPSERPMGAGLALSGRRRDGTEFPVDVALAPVTGGGETLVVAAVRDVTAQRKATAAQAELASIVESSVDAIIAITPDLKITSWNPAAQGLFGYDVSEIVGTRVTALVPEHASLALEALLGSAVEEGRHPARDTRWRRSDGEEVDVAVSISSLRDHADKLRGFSLLVRDISDRKRAERELRRLLAEEERLERQHAITSEIRLVLLSGPPLTEALGLICEHACELLDGDGAMIGVAEDEGLAVAAAAGSTAGLVGSGLGAEWAVAARTLATGHPLQVDDAAAGRAGNAAGPVLGIPIAAGGGAEAVLLVVREPQAPSFSNADVVAGESLAAQAALALELERARHDRDRMTLIADRERIARDLHDHVIQQLFATGMWLQAALPLIEREAAADRVSDAIESLDETIREIRNTIYGLLRPIEGAQPLRAEIMEVVKAAEEGLGARVQLELDGPIDTAVPGEVGPHVLAVVREGLSNAARHAKANHVAVGVQATGHGLVVSVSDDGVGVGTPARTSGLSNLAERAREMGGTLEITSPPEGGTQLVWTVPLPR